MTSLRHIQRVRIHLHKDFTFPLLFIHIPVTISIILVNHSHYFCKSGEKGVYLQITFFTINYGREWA